MKNALNVRFFKEKYETSGTTYTEKRTRWT